MDTCIIALEQAVVKLDVTTSPTEEDPNAENLSTLLDNIVVLS